MRYGKEVHQFTLSIDHNNKWIFVIRMNAFVKLPLTPIPPLGYGMVFLLKTRLLGNKLLRT
jgi:hypothetical protein